jgi:hypothetical protein
VVYEDGELARGSVNFGLAHLDVDEQATLEGQLTMIDVSGEGGQWSLRFEPAATHDRLGAGRDLPADGFDLRLQSDTVTLGPDEATTFGVALDLDSALLETGDYEGRIVATNGERTLKVPVTVRVESRVDDERIDPLTLHMGGNIEDECTGDGRADMAACGGPFLRDVDELSAAAEWVFRRHNSQGPAYFPLSATGPNTVYSHYHRGLRKLADGDIVQFESRRHVHVTPAKAVASAVSGSSAARAQAAGGTGAVAPIGIDPS